MPLLDEFSKKAVLVVDDDDIWVPSARRYLENAGLKNVHFVPDGVDGLRLAESLKPDLILLDIMLPGVSSVDVLEGLHIRKIDTRVVLISNYDTTEIGIRAARLGITDFIHKRDFFDHGAIVLKHALVYGHTIARHNNTAPIIIRSQLGIVQSYLENHDRISEIIMNIEEVIKEAQSKKPDKAAIEKRIDFLTNLTAGAGGNLVAHGILNCIRELASYL